MRLPTQEKNMMGGEAAHIYVKTVSGGEEPARDTYRPAVEVERRRGLWWLIPRLSLEWCQGAELELEASWTHRDRSCLERGEKPSCFLTTPNSICRSGKLRGWFYSLRDWSVKVHSDSQNLWFNNQWSRCAFKRSLEPCSWPPVGICFSLWFGEENLISQWLTFSSFFTSIFSKKALDLASMDRLAKANVWEGAVLYPWTPQGRNQGKPHVPWPQAACGWVIHHSLLWSEGIQSVCVWGWGAVSTCVCWG